jgi:hypothetical protein
MNYDAVIASAVQNFPYALEFQRLFPNAEHAIVNAKRQFEPAGWTPVLEWISRGHLYDRYVVWLVVAIDVGQENAIRELEKADVYVVQVEEVEGSKGSEGASWQFDWAEFEEGDWKQLVESGGDFASVGLEMNTEEPVADFAKFWNDTRPTQRSSPPDGIAFKAHLRFML